MLVRQFRVVSVESLDAITIVLKLLHTALDIFMGDKDYNMASKPYIPAKTASELPIGKGMPTYWAICSTQGKLVAPNY